MARVHRRRHVDATPALLREGYRFISARCDRYGTDAFEVRLLLRPTICLRGEEAARLFYDADRFERAGAMPVRVQKTLLGQAGVQGLDGADHRRRKAMFLSVTSGDGVEDLADRVSAVWRSRIPDWERSGRVVLLAESAQLLCRAVCDWANVPVSDPLLPHLTDQLLAMIDAPAAVGVRHRHGRRARQSAERWLAGMVDAVRNGRYEPASGSGLYTVAWHRDEHGALLPSRVAAVELLNLLRPTVAINRFVVFVALALHEHPRWRQRVATGDDGLDAFVAEVRRFYPFFPAVAARVRRDFDWHGLRFRRGQPALLDLYGTNRDPRIWDRPDEFRPDRFVDWAPNAFQLVPQGGSNHATDHRCAGEWVTIAVMKRAATLLTREMSYRVPPQDLRVSTRRMPTAPRSGFVLEGVRASS